ncbi:MAG: GNAT family N-acetyltransferase [Armatimonadota bacterium]|nr:GNAT family N-acetyltransferase [Armatimonadota bacterium]MDR7443614.1 GNAT family N-acetyltransferase [Armatimonadota bacterium]MDR7570189.1 GNAT family N-acetyltransferase [Armatimonadota bacterium]MDR7613856.1 GNAT family N-acetyltransferase [Armatimonadota bacterium]
MDEPSLSVRPASPQDRGAVAEILTSGFLEKFSRIFGPDPRRVARILADLPSSGRVFVAEMGGRVVGTLTLVLESSSPAPLWPVLRRHLSFPRALWALVLLALMGSAAPEPDTALIEAVAVLPQVRGRGVGRALMRRALEEARRAGKRRAALYVVEGNQPALRLYGSLGFRAERRVPLLAGRFLFGASRLLYMTRELAP